jgi:uncharacterized membrane protein YebE (DUF533 family)
MAGSLLEQMLETAMKNGGLGGGGRPMPGASGGGGLGDILGQVLGGRSGGSRSQPGGGLGDILGQVLGGGAGGASGGGLGDILGQVLGGGSQAGGAVRVPGGGTLGDDFRRKDVRVDGGPRSSREDVDPTPSRRPESTPSPGAGSGGVEIPRNLQKYGGIAILSILAWKVLQSYRQKPGVAPAPAPVPSPKGFDPANAPGGVAGLQDVLVDAMIAATQADGVVDQIEQQQLLGQLDKLGVDPAERQDLARRLGTAVDTAKLVKAAATPEIAVQIYAASALAIAIDTPRERQYLDDLAKALGIEPGLKAQIEQTIGKS